MNPGDINKSLKNLTPLKKGDRVAKAASSDRLNSIQNILHALCRGDNVVTGPNLRKKTQEGHFILSSGKGGRGGGGGEIETPFQVVKVARAEGDNRPGDLIGVISNSHLFNSEDRETYEEDNAEWGLLGDEIPAGDPNAWSDNNYPGNKIWLQIRLDESQVIQSIDVKHGLVGQGQWDTYPNPIEINDDDPNNVYQQFYHQIIAEITTIDDPRPGFQITNDAGNMLQVTQCLFNDLMMTSALTTRDADYPGLPLLVPTLWWMLPGTATDGTADEINDVPLPSDGSEPMTPWQFGGRDKIWNFQINDATDDAGMAVEVLDGMLNGVLPEGMGDDDFRVDITEWDLDDGEVDIVLTVEYDFDGTFFPNNISIDAVKPENYPEDEPFHSKSFGLGVVYVNLNGRSIDEIRNTILGDIDFQLVPTEVYAFQVFDASQADNPAVIIYDGDVIDQDGNGHTPEGMGNDNFIADGLTDGDSIFLQIMHDENWNITEVVTIEWEQSVPDDTDTVANIEIAYVEVFEPEGPDETVPQVIPHNTMCGDVFFDPPTPDDIVFDFKLEDATKDAQPKVRIYDGVVIGPNDDPIDPAGMPAPGDGFILDAFDGMEIWVGIQWDMETDDGVSGDNIVQPNGVWIDSGSSTPDDIGLIQYITIGSVGVEFDDEGFPTVFPINEVCGDIVIPYPPSLDSDELLQLSVDKDTGNIVWKTSKVAQVTAEETDFTGVSGDVSLDDIDVLTFDSADFSVWDGGGGQAVITNANVLSISCGSTLVESVNDISLDSDLFTLTDNGGGSVDIGLQTTTCT